jgi:hypothetical protein
VCVCVCALYQPTITNTKKKKTFVLGPKPKRRIKRIKKIRLDLYTSEIVLV